MQNTLTLQSNGNAFIDGWFMNIREAFQKKSLFLEIWPKLWVGGGQKSYTFLVKIQIQCLYGIFDHFKDMIFVMENVNIFEKTLLIFLNPRVGWTV